MRLLSSRRSFLGFAAAAATCPLCATTGKAADAHAGAPHWSYEGEHGPANWGEMSPDFRSCASGTEQTPIDLTAAINARPGPVQIAYHNPSYGFEVSLKPLLPLHSSS